MDFSHLKNKKVLVVDDFANVRKSIKSQLQDLGFLAVHEAHDADSASRVIKDLKVDLVLCDYNLGKGRDGSRLLEEWRSHRMLGQSAIFVLITAETSREIVISAMEFQPDDYLAKPFTMEVLANRIERWFERRQVLLPLLVSLEKKDWAAVGQCSRQIIEDHPRYRAHAQKYYVEALLQQNLLTEAENFLHGLLSKRFQSWAQAQLHRIDLMQNKYESAEAGLKAVLTKDPNLLDAYDFLTESLLAQEKDDEAQEWLEQAVQRAPKNIERQKKLSLTSLKNLQYHRAVVASKDIVNTAANTMHEHVGMYQTYIKNLQTESRHSDNAQRKREISREISNVNRKMNDRYANDPNSKLFSKALVVHNSKEPAAPKHTKDLNDLYTSTFEHLDDLISDTALFVVESYYLAERFSDADEMVNRFKKKFYKQPDVVKQLAEMQAEPVSQTSRKQAKDLNLKGINLYKNKQYPESIVCFRNAMELSPRHPGIILNFVQSHLLKMKEGGINKEEVSLCLEYINRLNYLPQDHYQYERFAKLKANLINLK